MGRPIVYCSECGRSLRDEDFQKGLAGTIENRPYCSACRTLGPPPATTSSMRTPAVSSGRTPKPFSAAPPPRKKSTALIAGAICGAALLVLVLGVSLSGGPRPAPPPAVVDEPPPPPPPLPPPRKPGSESAERAAAEKERVDRFERFLKDIRAGLEDARFDDRREEIRTMIARAGEVAGSRKGEVESLSALFTRRSLEASLRSNLVAHLKLDDLSGTAAADASGSGHEGKVVGKAAWTAARIGSGLETFGGGEHVELPDTPALKGLNKSSFSLTAWYLPRELPAGTDGPMHGIVVKPGNHTGLSLLPGGVFRMECWVGGKQVSLPNPAKSAPGRFYHVAGTVDTEKGRAALYVDGLQVKDGTWEKAAMRDYGAERWRVGTCYPASRRNWGPSKGVLDDVRLYSKALTAEDVKFLYDSAR